MRRFFAENIDTSGGSVILTGDEARHIASVLRMTAGDRVLLIDGSGAECVSEIESVGEGSVALRIIERREGAAEPDTLVTLFQCLPKQGKMEVIIQKCVELGVRGIVPAVSRRCVVKMNGNDNKLTRWNKVSQEASKQCGRAFVPEVTAPIQLDKVDFSEYGLVLLAYENESERSLKQALRDHAGVKTIAIVIGPEGGFEPAEVESMTERGAVTVSLGRRILRTETAGMAMLAQIMYETES